MSILEISGLSKEFFIHRQQRRIVSCQSIGLRVGAGEFVGISGRSGAGKSTILKCIHRTYQPSAGRILYESEAFGQVDLAGISDRQMLYLRRNEIGYVSQFLNVMPRTSAKEHVASALLASCASERDASEKAREMLAYFRLPEHLWDIYPNTFSGGERLRLNLAHTMVKRARLLLLDEPTASLDAESKTLVRDILLKLKGSAAMIGIFHDLEFMADVCDRVYHLEEGIIA